MARSDYGVSQVCFSSGIADHDTDRDTYDARLSLYALTQDSKPVEACGFDSTTYVNPTPHDQEHARTTLHLFGEVVIIPRKPLERGAIYEVSATVNDHPYQWSFTVSR